MQPASSRKLRLRRCVVYAPVAQTEESLALLKELLDEHGHVRYIELPSVAVEHKVLAGPFAKRFPEAAFYVCDQQYSFPVPLSDAFLGFPAWTRATQGCYQECHFNSSV